MSALRSLLPLAVLACSCAPEAGDSAPRNVLLVVFDTTRADRLSAYGHRVRTTPTVEALAARGARFEAAYAQSSLTPVSAGSFLTGTLPARHGIRSLMSVEEQSLAADATTLAERLARAGLATAGFVSARPMGEHYGLARGFELYEDDVTRGRTKAPCGNEYQRRADVTTELALDWLGERGLDPFFLLVHFFDPHDANLVPPRAFLEGRVSFPLPHDLDVPCRLMGLPDQARRQLYDAEVAYMDAQLARLLERLDRLRVLDQTLVVVTSDHGEGLGQHGNWTHGWLHREQVRVPLVLAGPGVPEGRVVEPSVRLIDLVPTVLDLLELPLTDGRVEGESMVALLEGRSEPPRPLYAEVHHDTGDFLGRDPAMFALEDGGWKLIHRPETGAHELYHVARDPGELENLYEPTHPEARRLLGELEALGVLGGALITSDHLTDDQREELEALGYLGESGGGDPGPPED